MHRLERLGWVLFQACLFVLAIATLVYVGYSFRHRYGTAAEASLTYEALRVAKGWALYIDPVKGAWEAGPPPSRYTVLYTPLWSWGLGHLAAPNLQNVKDVGRALSILAWLVSHVVPVWVAKKGKRAAPAIASLLGATVIFLSRNAPAAAPDMLAAALVALGLARAAKKDRVDEISAMFFTAAPFVKPSCLGLFAGAFLVCIVRRPPSGTSQGHKLGYLRTLIAGLATFGVLAGTCHFISDGKWISDMVFSTGQPISFSRWLVEFGNRSFVLGLPHAVVAFVAWRKKVSWVVLAPLLTSITWSTFSMAKLGSGTQYWHEPTIAAIVAIAVMANEGVSFAKLYAPLRIATLAFAILIVAITVPETFEQFRSYAYYDGLLARLEEHCHRLPGEVIVASNVVIELDLNGRFFVSEWQTSFLVRHGRLPIEPWRSDLRLPNVRWVVVEYDPEHPPANPLDQGRIGIYGDELRGVLRENFVFDQQADGLFIYRHR